ncbi:energy transducer TonB [Flavobacterium sp. RSSA_27]|uniref:energy transducer TonB n=1 Tax=Flavobacterium sp. RSSA_27 TaxID=3447667 RepID=UPI003F381824
MKRILFIAMWFFMFCTGHAQDLSMANDEIVPYNDVELRPELPGNYSSFMDFVSKNFSMPEYEGPTGYLKVGFVIEPNGLVSNVKVLKSLDSTSSEVIKKVMTKCPQWKPGEHNGKPVRVYYEFSLKLMNQS